MRVLIVSHRYPPSTSPRATRWAAIAGQWAAQGWQVTVTVAEFSAPAIAARYARLLAD